MNAIAILCSGQGAQVPTMFDTLAGYEPAEPVFSAARRVLAGRDPRDLVKQAEVTEIHSNRVAQILCCTHALAWWAILRPYLQRPLIAAGYSVGEVASWAISGAIDVDTTFEIVSQRADLMDKATTQPAGLAAVLGLPRSEIEQICHDNHAFIAIINAPQHYILGGYRSDLKVALDVALQQGATRTVLLPVEVPSHTPILKDATERFLVVLSERLHNASPSPDVRLLSGIDAMQVRHVDSGIAKLATQISTTVDWAACMDACRSLRPELILELGPGDALARMISQVAPEIPARSVADFRSVSGALSWMALRS